MTKMLSTMTWLNTTVSISDKNALMTEAFSPESGGSLLENCFLVFEPLTLPGHFWQTQQKPPLQTQRSEALRHVWLGREWDWTCYDWSSACFMLRWAGAAVAATANSPLTHTRTCVHFFQSIPQIFCFMKAFFYCSTITWMRQEEWDFITQ